MTGPWIIDCAAAGLAAGPVLRAVIVQFSIRPGSAPALQCAACQAAILPALRVALPLARRCVACRGRIGPPPLLIEAVAAGCLALIAARSTTGWELAALGWLAIVAVPLTFIDIAVRRLPDQLTVTAYAGTVTLLAAAALSAGQPGRPAVIAGAFTGLLAAGIYGICLLVLRRAGLRDMIAFGPFLALGALIAIAL